MDGGENDYAGFSVIGQSPFASTYRAFLPRLHAPVVVRVFASVIAEAPDAEERFVAEIRAIAAIDDPRLEPPVELGTSERGDLYVTRRRLSDESLGRLAEQGRLLGLPEALRVGAELADVAAHLDRRGVAHHAISPNNTFIGADGAVVVTDPIPAIALEGVPLGLRSRPAHVAPEILAGQPWSSAAESYSIMSTVTSILGHQALPTLITELVDECLAPEPTRRPAPAELAALLREARADLLTPRAPRRRRVIEEPQTGDAPLGPSSAPAGIAQTGAAAATAPPAASREPIVIDLRERGAHPADVAAAANAARLVPARGERSEPDEPGDAAGRAPAAPAVPERAGWYALGAGPGDGLGAGSAGSVDLDDPLDDLHDPEPGADAMAGPDGVEYSDHERSGPAVPVVPVVPVVSPSDDAAPHRSDLDRPMVIDLVERAERAAAAEESRGGASPQAGERARRRKALVAAVAVGGATAVAAAGLAFALARDEPTDGSAPPRSTSIPARTTSTAAGKRATTTTFDAQASAAGIDVRAFGVALGPTGMRQLKLALRLDNRGRTPLRVPGGPTGRVVLVVDSATGADAVKLRVTAAQLGAKVGEPDRVLTALTPRPAGEVVRFADPATGAADAIASFPTTMTDLDVGPDQSVGGDPGSAGALVFFVPAAAQVLGVGVLDEDDRLIGFDDAAAWPDPVQLNSF